MIRTPLWRALACAAMLAPAALVFAQGTTGSISGFVTDDTSGALPGATVTVRHVETDQKRVLVTDGAGRYRAQQLAPGKYEVLVELLGFRAARVADLPLTVGQDAVVNVQLKVGAIDEQVLVTGEAALVNMRQSSVAALVDEKQIRELPLNGRDFSQLTLLQAGVTASPSTPQQVDRGMGTQVSIAGARPNQISYQIDGTDSNTQGNGSPGSAAGGILGVDTVREFQVLVNNYSAEYGRSTGGIVTADTVTAAHTLSARYSWDTAQVDQDQAIPLWTTDTRTKSQSFVAEHKWIVRANLLNVAKVAWNRAYEATDNIERAAFDPKLFFVP